MKVDCPSCGQRVSEAWLAPWLRQGWCRSCGAIFDISQYLPDKRGSQAADRRSEPEPRKRPAVSLPRGIELQRSRPTATAAQGGPFRAPGWIRDDLVIVRRWLHRNHLVSLATGVLYTAGVIGLFAVGRYIDITTIQVAAAVMGIAAIFFVYWSVATLCNRTRLTVRDEALTVVHGPIPWPGKRRIAATQIVQIYCEAHVQREQRNHHRNESVPTFKVYDVNAKMKNTGYHAIPCHTI
ncbi:MAG: hypothetical protein AAGC55_12995, partial [Myxococcota bacterium]